jgi:hypothetical protein
MSGGGHGPAAQTEKKTAQLKPAKLVYEPKHKELYEKAKGAVKLEEHQADADLHGKGVPKAYETLSSFGKITHSDDAIDALTDAIIQYRKAADIPTSDKPQHWYYIRDGIEKDIMMLIQEGSIKGKDDIERSFRKGEGWKILNILLSHEYEKRVAAKMKDYVRKSLPTDLNYKTALGLVMYHAKENGLKLKEWEAETMAHRDGVAQLISNLYKTQLEEKANFTPYHAPAKKAGQGEEHGGHGKHGGGHATTH